MFISLALALFAQQVAANCTQGCDCVSVHHTISGHWTSDEACAKCSTGYQWWPCNIDGACECAPDTVASTSAPVESIDDATTSAPVQSTDDATTSAPVQSTDDATTSAPVESNNPVNPDRPCDSCGSCEAQPNNPHNASDDHCAPCANGGQSWWPCNRSDLCQCSDAVTSAPASTEAVTSAPASTEAASNDTPTEPASNDTPTEPASNDTPTEPASNDISTEPASNDTPTEPVSNDTPTEPVSNDETDNSHLDTKTRKAQASVFGDYSTVNWNQVICSMDESDAKPYMQQAHPHCAVAINMGSGAFKTTDQHEKPGFCTRTTPGNGAAKSSSCWKVRCVGSDNSLGLGVSCAHHNWVYLKTVDTNTENELSLTDDLYTNQCAPTAETENNHSCRAFDITVQAWDLMVVFASNQGTMAGEPAGLNGVVPVEYEEVDCNDPVAAAAISSSQCGVQNTLLI